MTTQKNPLEMLFHWAAKRPNKPFLFQPVNGEWHSYTWSQVADQVRRMATALQAMKLAPGSAIAISGRNTAHWVMADLAINLAGFVSVGLYPKQSLDAVRFVLEHSEAKILFLGPMPDAEEFATAVPQGITTIGFSYPGVLPSDLKWDELITRHDPLTDYTPPSSNTLMTLVYTSGTTGNPKGVMITCGNMMFAAAGLLKALPPKGQERLFSYLPLAHAFERGAVELSSLYFGAQVHFLEGIEKLAEQLKQVAPTRFFGVPLVYGRIQAGILRQVPQEKLDRLMRIPILRHFVRRKILQGLGLQNARLCIVGAAPMPIPLLEWFQKIGLTIYQGYGMTENNIYATCNRPGKNRIGSVGQPQPGAAMKLSDEGEILFKHGAVMAGYYKDPERTQETFTADGWLRTGDKGHIDKDGYLYITGRIKDIFKTLKGKYVAPAPIEGAMMRNADIDQLCFVGTGLKQPIMLVSLTPAAREKPREDVAKGLLADMEAVNKTLEPHEEIAKIIVVKDSWTIDNNLVTPTLKVRRNEIERRYAKLLEQHAASRDPIAWE